MDPAQHMSVDDAQEVQAVAVEQPHIEGEEKLDADSASPSTQSKKRKREPASEDADMEGVREDLEELEHQVVFEKQKVLEGAVSLMEEQHVLLNF